MFAGKARSLPQRGAPEWNLALLANIRLGRKGPDGTNTSLFGLFLSYEYLTLTAYYPKLLRISYDQSLGDPYHENNNNT
jgi:hypothetical protein